MLADDRKTTQSRSLLPSERGRRSQAITPTQGRKELHRKPIVYKGPSSDFSFRYLCSEIESSKSRCATSDLMLQEKMLLKLYLFHAGRLQALAFLKPFALVIELTARPTSLRSPASLTYPRNQVARASL